MDIPMKNTTKSYGSLSIAFHWTVAITIIGLFSLGYWMVDLGYYDPWYQDGPFIHKSIGVLLFIVMIARLAWKMNQPQPEPLPTHSRLEQITSHAVHNILYLLIFCVILFGYLISTADGRDISVFNLFSVPSLGSIFSDQEDIAGFLHKYTAYAIAFLVFCHVAAVIKHHKIDKDNTLKRMIGRS